MAKKGCNKRDTKKKIVSLLFSLYAPSRKNSVLPGGAIKNVVQGHEGDKFYVVKSIYFL